jgi:hypothetical protein
MDINLCSASKALKASCVSLLKSNLPNSLGFAGLVLGSRYVLLKLIGKPCVFT